MPTAGVTEAIERHAEDAVRRYARLRDAEHLDAAFAAFQPLARRLARRYRRTSVSRDDLEQAAYLGLLKALRRFEPERGCRFSSFAIPTILGELRRECRETVWTAHVPRPMRERVALLRAASDELGSRLGRSPRTSELASRLGWDQELVLETRLAASSLAGVSLDAPVRSHDDDGAGSVGDRLGDEDPGFELAECKAAVEDALRVLDEEERHVLRLHFADSRSFAEIGEELAIGPARAGRLVRRSLEHLSALTTRDATAQAAW